MDKILPIDWQRVTPDLNDLIQIQVFDDGKEKYKQSENSWILFGRWKGKVALFNAFDDNVIIGSISEWKTSL
jgi:hypothetical protein